MNKVQKSALQEFGNRSRWLAVLGLAFGALALTACDPNNFDPRMVDQMNQLARQQITGGSLAVVGCRGSVRPALNLTGNQLPTVQSMQNQRLAALTSQTASFHVLSIDTSSAYNSYYGRANLPITDVNSGVGGYVTRYELSFGSSDLGDIQISRDGSLVIVSFRGGNQVGFMHLTPGGQLTDPLSIPVGARPGHIAVGNDFAAIVVDGGNSNNLIQLFDLRRKDAFGRAVPRIYGTGIPTPFSNIPGVQISDIRFDAAGEVLFAAAGRAGIAALDIEKAVGEEPADYNNAAWTLTSQAVKEGYIDQFQVVGNFSNLLAVRGDDLVVGNGALFAGGLYTAGAASSLFAGRYFNVDNSNAQNRLDASQVRDMDFSKSGTVLMAMTSSKIHIFPTRDASDIGYQRPRPLLLGNNNSDLAVGNGYALVADPGTDSVYVLRTEVGGTVSFGGPADTINMASYCADPTKVAISNQTMQQQQALNYYTGGPQLQQQPGQQPTVHP